MQRTSLGGALIETATHPKMVGVGKINSEAPLPGDKGKHETQFGGGLRYTRRSLHKTQINLHNQKTVNSTIIMATNNKSKF